MNFGIWFDRFWVARQGDYFRFKDSLYVKPRLLPVERFPTTLDSSTQMREFFRQGFLRPCILSFPRNIAQEPGSSEDCWFWQFPARTEADAYDSHSKLSEVPWQDGDLHCYLGIPWATFIDRNQTDETALMVLRVRVNGFRRALAELGVTLRVHTVCQHIKWRKMLPLMEEQGVTDLWASHAIREEQPQSSINLHPWSLYAVNVEDPNRCQDIFIGQPPEQKQYLASFIGAHTRHYLSDVRLRLKELTTEPDCLIQVTDQWHFQDVVYQHQVRNTPLESSYRIDETVRKYNHILSESVFSLCPGGSGPNTIRLWESLAVGSIPVLIGPSPWLPEGGTLDSIDWSKVVLYSNLDEISQLPRRLRQISKEEILERQSNCIKAYKLVSQQRCF